MHVPDGIKAVRSGAQCIPGIDTMLQVSDSQSMHNANGGVAEQQCHDELLTKPARMPGTSTTILIMSRLEPGSGNLTTANRIRWVLEHFVSHHTKPSVN